MSGYRDRKKHRIKKMKDNEVLMMLSAIDERTTIILDQQEYMRKEISILKSKSPICDLHPEMEKKIQKLLISDAKFSGELNILDLKTKFMIGGGVVFLSSVVSLVVSKFAILIF